MAEVYVSTDVEADGPIPGPNSMLSFASAAYLADKTLVGTFEANLERLPGATVKRNMPSVWFHDLPHTHVALDDAKGQGALFCNMLAARRRATNPAEPRAAADPGHGPRGAIPDR
jgi:hypothetical protein